MPAASHRHNDRFRSPDFRSVYLLKAVGMLGILATMWVIKETVFPAVPAALYTVIILLVLLPTLAVVLWPGNTPVPPGLVMVSFAADILAITVGIHFGGGADNVSGPILYAMVIGLGGLILSENAAYFGALLSAVAYGLLVLAEQWHLLPHRVPYAKPPDDAAATVITVSIYLLLSAWVVSYSIRRMRAIYRRIDAARSESVSALSHDLKNPLGVIQGYAELLEEAEPADRAEFIRGIQRATRQALDLVRNVLDAASIEEPSMVLHREPVPLNGLVQQVLDSYQFAADAKQLRLSATLAPALPDIPVDSQLIVRAIGNLVSNAIKYTGANGTVRVTTSIEGGGVRVAVHDTGCGIAPAEQRRIFEKYSRAGGERRIEGTGLGLYIVQRIAAAHGGTVHVVSEVGTGSTFSLDLPMRH